MESGGCSVCFRGDFAIKHTSWIPTLKLVWKCRHTLKHFIYMQYFSCWLVLLSFLYIELALVGCTNPDNVHCFGDCISESEICYCINLRRSSVPHAIRPIRKWLNCQTTPRVGAARFIPMSISQKQRCGSWVREMTWHLYTRGVPGRMKAKQRWFEFTLSWMVPSRSASCSWRPLHWRIRHSHLTSKQFHCFVRWLRPLRNRPQRTRLSQLENSAIGMWPIHTNIMPAWFEKWRYVKFWYMC